MFDINILYVGQLFDGSTALHRKDSLSKLVNELNAIDSTSQTLSFSKRIRQKLNKVLFNNYCDFERVNQRIIYSLENQFFHLLWIDKGLIVEPSTLQRAKDIHPNLIIVSYSPDDMINPQNQTNHYIASLPLYDYFVTTKSYNVEELQAMGGQRGIFVDNAFAENVHIPMKLTSEEKGALWADVGFIGSYEEDRYQQMRYLADNDIKIRIWGESWRQYIDTHPNLEIITRPMFGLNYTKVINATMINLCFLRKVNRDLQTTRSVEIPACGAFMLAERTDEHVALFKEGEEADFFSDKEELLEKVIYYLKNSNRIKEIGLAARRRCISSGYSNEARLRKVLETLLRKENQYTN